MNWKRGFKILVAGIFFLLPWAASAQQVNMYWNTGGCSQFSCWGPVSAANPLPVSASVTASIAGYHPSSSLTPITATTGGVTSGSFTAGQSILVQNVGSTNAAYCAPGSSASTFSQYIAPGSSALITTTSETAITCATSTSTTTVNFQVGTGLWTGAGGGGGGGGSSGAVFGPNAVGSANANPPVVIGGTVTGAAGQIVEGVAVKPASTASIATDFSLVTNESPNSLLTTTINGISATTAHGCSIGGYGVLGCLGQIDDDIKGSIPAGTNLIGKFGIDQTAPGTTNAVSATNFPATVATGTGAQGSTVPRVTVATDTATIAGSAPGPAADSASVPSVLSPTASATSANSHAGTTALGTSLVAKASAGNLYAFNCTGVAGGAAGYCIVYNGTTVPSTGALTGANVLDFCYFDTTARGCSLNRIPIPVNYSTGIVVLVSSAASPYTYTTGVDTAAITADYK
jgi:hypothetical protein